MHLFKESKLNRPNLFNQTYRVYILLIQYVLFSFLRLNNAKWERGEWIRKHHAGFDYGSVAIKFCLFGGGYK